VFKRVKLQTYFVSFKLMSDTFLLLFLIADCAQKYSETYIILNLNTLNRGKRRGYTKSLLFTLLSALPSWWMFCIFKKYLRNLFICLELNLAIESDFLFNHCPTSKHKSFVPLRVKMLLHYRSVYTFYFASHSRQGKQIQWHNTD